jgi:hypothetical protein
MLTLQKKIKPSNGVITFRLPKEFLNKELDVFICQSQLEPNTPVGSESKIKMSDLFGSWKNDMTVSSDFDAPLDDFKDYME